MIETQPQRKRLGKNPEDFPDAKGQPHVQVALRMKQRGGSARSGDVIPYIFSLAEGQESARSAQADRAKHPDELRKAGAALTIGLFITCTLYFASEYFGRLRTLPFAANITTSGATVRSNRRHRESPPGRMSWLVSYPAFIFYSQPTFVRTGPNALSTNDGLK